MQVVSCIAFPATAAALMLGACTEPSAPDRQGDAPGRVATVEWEGNSPILFLQNADGNERVRVHFDNVTDDILGNDLVPVTDAALRDINRTRWSPDGRYLAVTIVVSPAFDASQVVLVSADGQTLRTVGPNGLYIGSDVEWSPDSRRIAYVMATDRLAVFPDLFMTDLGTNQVIRLTTQGLLTWYDTSRFDASGTRLYFTEHTRWAPDGINLLTRIAYVDLASGLVVEGDEVLGEPQGLSRTGTWGLFIRWSATHPDQRELFRRSLNSSTEVSLSTGDLAHAVLQDGDREAVVSSWNPDQATRVFRVVGVESTNDVHATLPTQPSTTWAALWRASR